MISLACCSVTVVPALIAAATLFYYLARLIHRQYTYWPALGVPHARPLPLLGNSASLALRATSFAEHVQRLYADAEEAKTPKSSTSGGPRYRGFFDFGEAALLLRDPELVRRVCVTDFEHFTDHQAFVTEAMDPVAGRNLFTLAGQRWREVRSTLSPSYTSARMRAMFGLIDECARDFARYFVEHPEEAECFEAKEVFSRYTNDVIATSAFGLKTDSMREKNNEFFYHGTRANPFVSLLEFAKITLLRFFPRTLRLFGATFFSKSSDRFFKRVIGETVAARREGRVTRPDMIQLLVEAMGRDGENGGSGGGNGVNICMDDIVAQSLIFFLAGFESTSSLVSFAALELAANPAVQERLSREIDERLAAAAAAAAEATAGGDNDHEDTIAYETLADLKYLDMVLSETLRKYPPAAVTNRVCVKETDFPPATDDGQPGFRMERGTIVSIPIFALHRDPRYFPEPELFEPERFAEENKRRQQPYAYLPFGLGPRQCIANRFALMQTKLILVRVLRNFRIVLAGEKTRYPVRFTTKSFTLGAEDGIWLRFEDRKKAK